MTVLDAAKALAAAELVTYNHDLEMYQCGACEGLGYGREKFEHGPDCPVPMLPQIVAALEAGERLKIYRPAAQIEGWYVCQFCGMHSDAYPMDHETECPWQAFKVALATRKVAPSGDVT